MFFANLSKRKVLLLIINSLISVLMVSCIIFLYYYLPTGINNNTSDIRTFTIEKDQSVNLKKSSYSTNNNLHNNNKIKNKIQPPGLIAINNNINNNNNNINNNQNERDDQSSSVNDDDDDDTIYIDNDNYMDENYYNSVGNNVGERPLVNPVTPSVLIVKRPLIKIPKANSQYNDDFYYDYETDDDSDDVSSGNGKIVVNIKSIIQKVAEVPENVYSVSSEIVSNLKNKYDKYSIVDQKQINKPDVSDERTDTEADSSDTEAIASADDEAMDDDWSETKKRRLIGNKKKSNERSRQLLLCESAGSGELCRMLFKG